MYLTYLLVWVHGSEASAVRSFTTLLGDVLDLLLGAVGKVAWVGVIGHGDDVLMCSWVEEI